jgi:hypothetical protein
MCYRVGGEELSYLFDKILIAGVANVHDIFSIENG